MQTRWGRTVPARSHPDAVTQLERLLHVDRTVPVAQVVVGDDTEEPATELVPVDPHLDGCAHERFGLGSVVPSPPRPACGTPMRVVPAVAGRELRRRTQGSTALLLGDAGDGLHDGQRPSVAVVPV